MSSHVLLVSRLSVGRFRSYTKKELAEYKRGFMQEAYTKIEAGDIKWLQATLWADARFVTALATTHTTPSRTTVRRWHKLAGRRQPVPTSNPVKRYNQMMGAVDRFNKRIASLAMGMGRCKQRFQRALFLGWLFPAVGVVNVCTAVKELVRTTWGEAALNSLLKAHGVKGYTFDRWFELRLGELLLRKGVRCASEAVDGGEPHFMPMKRHCHWERPLSLPLPSGQPRCTCGPRAST